MVHTNDRIVMTGRGGRKQRIGRVRARNLGPCLGQTAQGGCDDSRLFVSDSHPSVRSIWTMTPPAEGAVRVGLPRALFAHLGDVPGRPDGAAFDDEDGYWIAGVGGGELYRFAPDGRLSRRIRTPVESPTKLAFGGADLGDVFVTSKQDAGEGGRLAIWRSGAETPRGARTYRWRLR